MPIQLEKKAIQGLISLAKLSDEVIARIQEDIANLKERLSITSDNQLAEIFRTASGLEGDDLKLTVGTLGGMLLYLTESNGEDKVLDDIVASASRVPEAAEVADLLRKNLSALFAIPKLYSAFKAASLSGEAERLFRSSRIITDVRPVFGDALKSGILGYIVTHTLKLTFEDIRGRDEFYVAVDEKDLKALKETIDRALEKQALLRERSGLSTEQFIALE